MYLGVIPKVKEVAAPTIELPEVRTTPTVVAMKLDKLPVKYTPFGVVGLLELYRLY